MSAKCQTVSFLEVCLIFRLLILLNIGLLANANESLKTGVFVAVKAQNGSKLCAISAPVSQVSANSRLECHSKCLRVSCQCASGANYRIEEKLCEMYAAEPTVYQVVHGCNYHKATDIRPLTATCSGDCPANFTYVPSVSSCYYAIKDPVTWFEAQQRCISLHPYAHLVTISSDDEQTAVVNLLHIWQVTAYHAYTAGNRDSNAVPFVWRPRTKFTYSELPITYTKWQPGDPNNGATELCMGLWPPGNYRWIDTPCYLSHNAVCEVDIA